MLIALLLTAALAVRPSVGHPGSLSRSRNATTACEALAKQGSSLIPGKPVQIYVSQVYPNGTNFTTPDASVAYTSPVPNLPEFCRFGAVFNTSKISSVRFEVWLPTKTWNSRFAFMGNGGDAGGVNYPGMGIPLAKYGFAVASTDTGHNGSSADGTFAINNPESQIDFGHRAVHLSTVYAKNVVKAFYGKKQHKNYWLGCSSGGKQGLKELQEYPEDFDGVLFGSPAYWWSNLNGWTIQSNLLNQVSNPGYINASTWGIVHTGIMSQCDALDGLKDSMITNPAICKPNFSKMAGLTSTQAEVAKSIYVNWTDKATGKFLFPAFSPGAEWSGAQFVLGQPYEPAPDYFRYQVLNYTSISTQSFTNTTELIKLTYIGDKTDPGQTTAFNTDIRPFMKRGGKMIGYVGTADQEIPTYSSIYYHEKVRERLGHDPGSFYKLYTVPGMGHCSGGYGPSSFGASSQSDESTGGSGQSATFDAKHDMILSLIAWTERGIAPKEIIGTYYNGADRRKGVAFQRPLCPWPQTAKYLGGNANVTSSFKCH